MNTGPDGKQDDEGSMFRCFDCGGREFASLGEFERHQLEFHVKDDRSTKSAGSKRLSRNASEAVR